MFNGRRRSVSRVRISAQCKQEQELQEHDSPGVIAHLFCMHVGQPCLCLHVSEFSIHSCVVVDGRRGTVGARHG